MNEGRKSCPGNGWSGLLILLLLWLTWLPVQAQGRLWSLSEARLIQSTPEGQTVVRLALPYHWDREQHNRPGSVVLELPFALPELAQEPHGLYFPRIGNRAEIWLNGVLLAQLGQATDAEGADYAKAPQYVPVPEYLLRTDNLLTIILWADGGRRAGLSRPLLGPASQVRAHYERDYRWRVSGSLVVAVFSLVIGVIALLLWFTQRDYEQGDAAARQGIYLSAGLAELCWVLRMLDLVLEQPPLDWPAWQVLQTMVFAGWMCGVSLFCHHVAGWDRHFSMRWMWRVLLVLLLSSGPLAYVSLHAHDKVYLTTWYGVVTLLFVGYGLAYGWGAWRQRTFDQGLVATAGLLNIAVGARDWLAIRASDDFEASTWIRYSSMLFGLALLIIVVRRFRQASQQANDLMRSMASQVREKAQALDISYRQLEQLVREQERAAERARVLRDMHDGVGAHISAAIRQLQTGPLNQPELLQTLRDSLDQLKLSIDAMNLPHGDVTGMLASLRYRLEPRLKAAGIALHWDVDLLAPLASLDDKAMRHLQYMVFEILSNVLQHAQASEVGLALHATPSGGACLRVIDNGHGFDPGAAGGAGLRSLRERAAALRARLSFDSVPGVPRWRLNSVKRVATG